MRRLLCETRRMFTGYRFYTAVIGMVLALFFSLENYGMEISVVDTWRAARESGGELIFYSFAAFAYATVFCEDLEHKYIYYDLTRENLRSYVIRKSAVIFGSSVLVVVAATAIFSAICRFSLPWIPEDTQRGAYQFLVFGAYGGLLEKGHAFWFLVMNAARMGMLAGLLSLMASLFSLFVSNRVMVLCFPPMFMEFFYLMSFRYVHPAAIDGLYGMFGARWMDIWISLLICAAVFAALTGAIYKTVKHRL